MAKYNSKIVKKLDVPATFYKINSYGLEVWKLQQSIGNIKYYVLLK